MVAMAAIGRVEVIATLGPVVDVIATRLLRTDVEVDLREGPSTSVAAVGMPKVSERGRPAGMLVV